jgi:hypothetical protein
MTEAEATDLVQKYFEGLFPKSCPNCQRRFATLREYIQVTQRVGPVMSYDAEVGDWHTKQPIGSLAQANCPCGSTLSLSTEHMPMPARLALLDWLRIETRRRGVSASELLDRMRNEIRRRVLADSTPGGE